MEIIIYAIIAVILAYRLYTVLGQRHEGERQRPNPFAKPPPKAPEAGARKNAPRDEEDVLAFPLNQQTAQDAYANPLAAGQALPAPDSLAGGLYAIRAADPDFDEKIFLKGARMAFEMIVHAFAAGERDALKNLMSGRLYQSFASAIEAREMAGEKMDVKALTLIDAEIVGARMDGDEAQVSIRYISTQRKDITARDGTLKTAGTLEQLTDLWVFRRDAKSGDPNWTLVETRTV